MPDRNSNKKSLLLTVMIQLIVLTAAYFMIAWEAPSPLPSGYGIELDFDQNTNGMYPLRKTPRMQSQKKQGLGKTQTKPAQSKKAMEQVADHAPNDLINPDSKAIGLQRSEKPPIIEPVDNNQIVTATNNEEKEENTNRKEPKVIDERALYEINGKTENKNGAKNNVAKLEMTGWKWDNEPRPYDDSNEVGRIVFHITIDEDGYIIGLDHENTSISPSIRVKYEEAVRRLTFSKTSGSDPAPTSKGRITFIIRSF